MSNIIISTEYISLPQWTIVDLADAGKWFLKVNSHYGLNPIVHMVRMSHGITTILNSSLTKIILSYSGITYSIRKTTANRIDWDTYLEIDKDGKPFKSFIILKNGSMMTNSTRQVYALQYDELINFNDVSEIQSEADDEHTEDESMSVEATNDI